MARYEHSGNAQDAHLVGTLTATGLGLTIDSFSGWPTGATNKFWIAVDPDTASEEHILVSSRSSGALTVAAIGDRGKEGTAVVQHDPGAVVRHIFSATEADDMVAASAHYLSTGTAPTVTVQSGAGSGATASVAGTDTRGVVTLNTGTGTLAGTILVNLTFAAVYAAGPTVVITHSGGVAAAASLYLTGPAGTTGFNVQSVNAPAASSTLKFTYVVVG